MANDPIYRDSGGKRVGTRSNRATSVDASKTPPMARCMVGRELGRRGSSRRSSR